MTLEQRLLAGITSLVTALSLTCAAAAAAPKALSDTDAHAYAAAFDAVEQGDFVGAELTASEIQDKSLTGYLSFGALMHPTAHKASFEELAGWLIRFKDLPLAERVFSLATKRKPAEAPAPQTPEITVADGARSEVTRPAREAFYSGDSRRAYELAVSVGERWIAGLAAWRLADYAQARDYFGQVARDDAEDPWLRAAGAYWAARASVVLGDKAMAGSYLRLAARSPQTFYGMIAERQTQLSAPSPAAPMLMLAGYHGPAQDLPRFIRENARAHRATALAQIGRVEEARQELRAGLALARTGADRNSWSALLATLGAPTGPGLQKPQYLMLGDYQAPPLEPANGFTMDRALVYAIVRQESAFNPTAISHAGAVGLMQLLPTSAALAMGDANGKISPRALCDPAFNLRAGQDYLAWLMSRGVGSDLLRMVAAYNAGPGAVLKTTAMVGEDDPFLMIESLPALETRNYVEKVVAAYWTYKRMFGEEARTLDALATGARRIDLTLDLADPNRAPAQVATQPLQVGAASVQQASTLN